MTPCPDKWHRVPAHENPPRGDVPAERLPPARSEEAAPMETRRGLVSVWDGHEAAKKARCQSERV